MTVGETWHVPIAPDHWQYLGVHYEHQNGAVSYWVWKVLCLGLRDVAFIFTKSIAPIMAYLRKDGLRGLCYIDDKFTLGHSFNNCLWWEIRVKQVFAKAGWIFKPGIRLGDLSQV